MSRRATCKLAYIGDQFDSSKRSNLQRLTVLTRRYHGNRNRYSTEMKFNSHSPVTSETDYDKCTPL